MRRLTEKKRHELDLLCRAGAGLAPIAPPVCRLVRELVGAEACALFWLDAQGRPEGFFHEHSTADAQELFLNEFDRLFIGPSEINIATLAKTDGARIGQLLDVPASYYRSNTFNLLVKASGHHHSLDLRVDVDGQARAVLLLFRTRALAFDGGDAALLARIEPYLHRALTSAREGATWAAPASRTGHLLVGQGGRQLLMFSDEADGPLDPERKRMFMAMKREVLRLGGYQREFFVSQTPELTAMADAVIDLETHAESGKAPAACSSAV